MLAVMADAFAPAAMDAVEFQQMGRCSSAARKLIDMGHVKPGPGAPVAGVSHDPAERRTKDQPADAAETVYTDSHITSSPAKFDHRAFTRMGRSRRLRT
jgi:hypothetical protein